MRRTAKAVKLVRGSSKTIRLRKRAGNFPASFRFLYSLLFTTFCPLAYVERTFARIGRHAWSTQAQQRGVARMFPRKFALYAPEEGVVTGGAGGGGSPGGGQGNETDKEVVPKTQFLAALSSAERKRESDLAALRAEFEEKLAKATAKTEAPKRYTRAELLAAVDARTITQEQADVEWERQIREDATTTASRVATATVTANQRKERVDSEIARYTTVAPEILDDTHDTRQKIKVEFQALVDLGDDPRDVATQLKAIRSVLGPVEKLEKSRSGKPANESHRETGGGGDGKSGGKGSGKAVDALSERQKQHYEKLINAGQYKNWDEVEKELTFKRKAA